MSLPSRGESFRDAVRVSGDAAATASNILSHESQLRLGVAGDILSYAGDVAVALILYVLLAPVSKNLALLAAFFRVAFAAAAGINKVTVFAALFTLGDAKSLHAFQPEQLQALAYLFLRLHTYGFALALVFFAFHLLVLGYLIYRSGYLPKLIGVLLIIAGPSYLVNSLALFLAPRYASVTFLLLLLGFVAELSLCLWLIVKGVNAEKWQARAA